MMRRRQRPCPAQSAWRLPHPGSSQWPLLVLLLSGILLVGQSIRVRPAAAQPFNQCAPPSVTINVMPPSALVGQPVRFDYSATAGAGCTQATAPLPTMLINFGDGRAPLPLNGPSGTITHIYTVPGTYAVLLTATSAGRMGRVQTTVRVGPAAQQLAVTLRATPLTVRAGDLVDFLGQVVTGSGDPNAVTTSATLLFGDGQAVTPQTTGAGFIAQHAYTSVGTYAATLSVTNSSGQTAQASVTITVVPRTIAWS